jgi:hypothetical protein
MDRAVLKNIGVPVKFWAEVARHSVYLINRLPTKALGDRTLMKLGMAGSLTLVN